MPWVVIYINLRKISLGKGILLAFSFNNPLNYRPISLLSHVSKIFETLIYMRLMNFLHRHTIISNCQFVFRKNHSMILAMNDLCENILQMKQKDKHISLVFLDLSKAFDSVNHGILTKSYTTLLSSCSFAYS